MGGKDLKRGGKTLGRRREKISGGKKALEGDNSKRTQIRKQACNVGGLSRRR